MKYRATKKEVMNNHSVIIKLSYCELQDLLNSIPATAYTCGIYGWNADIYESRFYNACVVVGYRPFGNYEPKRETVKTFNASAEKIKQSFMKWTDRQKALEKLFNEFIAECVREYYNK